MIETAIVALIAGVTDWRSRRIPNWLTLPAAAVGLAMNSAAYGWSGLKISLAGMGLGLLLLFPFVLLRALGAGDWKLAGALGAFLGVHQLLLVLLVAAMIAGLMALALVLHKRRFGQMLRNVGHLLLAIATGHPGHPSVSLDNPESLKVPFGVAFALAAILFVAGQLGVYGS
ncbi:MAG: prepilin peptidase [Acidobacteria bacterium]|nr:prepilin peptidase [Acidobacteriota bacterium]MBV8894802.1 prepilin peptidase [Acidobacteriota bacterium]MBV9482789.1 prepilin peptidase [Acidobacteriota bacterium]